MAQGIRILTGCRISGRGIAPGTYAVPGDLSEDEAAFLARIGRGELVELKEQVRGKKRSRHRVLPDDDRRD